MTTNLLQRSLFAATAVLAAAAGPASAAVMYVDATSGAGGNTTFADGSTFTPPLNGTTGTDNLWEQRTTFGSSGNIYEASGEAAETSIAALRTTVTGLIPLQEYRVYTFFWEPSSAAEDWNIRSGLASTALTLFANPDAATDVAGSTGAGLASALAFSTAPTILLESSRDLRAANLGTAFASAGGQINVFVDDLGTATGVNQRTWYDGAGVEAVPEPASLGLSAAAALGLAARRRRRRRR